MQQFKFVFCFTIFSLKTTKLTEYCLFGIHGPMYDLYDMNKTYVTRIKIHLNKKKERKNKAKRHSIFQMERNKLVFSFF